MLPSYADVDAGGVSRGEHLASLAHGAHRVSASNADEQRRSPHLGPFGEEDDEDDALFNADLDSEFEDEDADLYLDLKRVTDAPHVADLPWIGEAPKQPAPSSRAPMYANDRMIVVVDIEGGIPVLGRRGAVDVLNTWRSNRHPRASILVLHMP